MEGVYHVNKQEKRPCMKFLVLLNTMLAAWVNSRHNHLVMSLEEFRELGLTDKSIEALRKKGFEEPTEIQRRAIPLLLKEGTEIVGQAQTGTGKTAAFALPILETVKESGNVQALILVPTRELASQVSEEMSSLKGERKLEIAPIYGGASMSQQLRKLKRGVEIVVGTPGRVLDHISRGSLILRDLEFLVLDEADEMLDMGFIDDIEAVLRAVPEKRRMMLFSATMPPAIMKLASQFMKTPEIIRTQKQDSANLATDQIYYEVREADKLEALTRIIDRESDFYGVVFCRTKLQCDEIVNKLHYRGYDAAALHGDLSQREREAILHKMKEHQISILVATDVAARGLDIQDLTHVINYSIPQDPEIYIHRVGRTGRAGKNGTAITFITPSEARKFSYIRKAARTDIRKEEVPGAEEIIEKKKERIKDEILNALSNEPKTEYIEIAREVLEGRDAEEAFAAFLSTIYKNELDATKYREITVIPQKKEKSRHERREAARNKERFDKTKAPSMDEGGITRLYIARGRKDGLTKAMLSNIIIDQTGIRDEDIRDIEINETSSFISAPFAIAETILHAYSDRAVKGKPIVSRAKPESRQDSKKKSAGRREAFRGKGKRRKSWEEDYQPYGRDTRDGEDGRYRFPDRKGKGKARRRR